MYRSTSAEEELRFWRKTLQDVSASDEVSGARRALKQNVCNFNCKRP